MKNVTDDVKKVREVLKLRGNSGHLIYVLLVLLTAGLVICLSNK